MSNGVYIALSGAMAQSNALDVVANNVANANTSGHKAQRVNFSQVMSEQGKTDLVIAEGMAVDTSAGSITQTDRPLDVALDGDGYFSVQTPNGIRYTRAGNLHVDATGTLVNGEGNAILAAGGASLTIPPGSGNVTISAEGAVFADANEVGRLSIEQFAATDLQAEGSNLFVATGDPITGGTPARVMSGYVEGSNFNVVRGMTDMVKISRTYEALHRMIETYRQLDERTAREIGSSR